MPETLATNLTFRLARIGPTSVTLTLLDRGVREHETITMSTSDAQDLAKALFDVSKEGE